MVVRDFYIPICSCLFSIHIYIRCNALISLFFFRPLHNLKSLKKKQEQAADKSTSSPDSMKDDNDNTALIAKEHFVFTDPEGQLYHFSVEGNAIKDGTKVPAEASLCE